MTNSPECNILKWLDPAFATIMGPACAAHDDAYHAHEGSRLTADWRWAKAAWAASPWRACIYAPVLLSLGWILWYDLDEAPRHAMKTAWRWLVLQSGKVHLLFGRGQK